MTWDVETLKSAFTSDITTKAGGFFILTNSRAFHPYEAKELIKTICINLQKASQETSRQFEIVLRSDSTLRGHFPLEADVASEVLGEADLWLLAPFFLQGGRYTINDIHYVDESGTLVPAGDTQFAKDATFGYKESNLKDWVVEKSSGAFTRDRVQSLSIQDIRTGGPKRVCELLESFGKGSVVVVNAASENDMDVVVAGLLDGKCIRQGASIQLIGNTASKSRKFLFRSGAALVSSRLGIAPIPPKTAQQLQLDQSVGGLIIAGSYVPKTTAQLEALKEKSGSKLTTVTLEVEKLLSKDSNGIVIKDAQELAAREIQSGQGKLRMDSSGQIMLTKRTRRAGNDQSESRDWQRRHRKSEHWLRRSSIPGGLLDRVEIQSALHHCKGKDVLCLCDSLHLTTCREGLRLLIWQRKALV